MTTARSVMGGSRLVVDAVGGLVDSGEDAQGLRGRLLEVVPGRVGRLELRSGSFSLVLVSMLLVSGGMSG